MEKIKILHLSDIHFGIADEDDEQPLITEGIKASITDHVKRHRTPDLCIFSGDLTQSGRQEEFDLFESWLESLFADANKTKISVFIVPGNHEVQRSTIGSDEYYHHVGLRRSVYASSKDYQSFRDNVITIPGAFKNFLEWHKDFKKRTKYNVISCWDKELTGCSKVTEFLGIKTRLLGLNTALLSCDNNDQGKLIADGKTLNGFLKGINPTHELIISVGHHPIGKLSEESWLVNWNNEQLEETLLATKGPHIYLHGHIHKTMGITLNLTAGQNITILGAGACYQHKEYPMFFAFYDIDIDNQIIKPFTYKYNPDNKAWPIVTFGPGSNPIRAVLPLLTTNKADIKALKEQVLTLQNINKKLNDRTHETYNILENVLDNLHREKELRHHFKSIKINCDIDGKGNASISETFEIVALNHPLHFWRCAIFADKESEPIGDIKDINIRFTATEGDDISMYISDDSPRKKKMTVLFFPEVKPNRTRTFTRTYHWPNYVPHLLEGKEVTFSYNHPTGDETAICDFIFVIKIEKSIGTIQAEKVGESGGENKKLKKRAVGSKYNFKYQDKNVMLNKNKIEFRFKKVD